MRLRGARPRSTRSRAAIVIFIIVAVIHDRVERRHAHQSALADLNRESQDRIARNWSKLPEPSVAVESTIIRTPAISIWSDTRRCSI